ncbi:MAG TPA: hypothetical protein VHS99_13330 [Chloroflexota bacterium]|nr:hypothetical protein [Chloroflexota bacterium]
MNELVALVSQKTGLPEAQSRMAVETVIGFLRERLPPPVAQQLDAALGSQAGGTTGNMGNLGEMARGLGGLFEKK